VRLAVIGDTQHYIDDRGRICALEPVTLQLDRWAALFDEVVLCAPLDPGPPPAGFAPYGATNLRLEPLRKAGGNTRAAKLGLLAHLWPWARTTRRVARSVDAVHLRCPCNIGLVAIFSTWRAGCLRSAMYAGVWHDYAGEPRFFGLQRKLLASRWFGGPVSVYAEADPARPHLEPFFSPSYSEADLERAAPGVRDKVRRISDPSVTGPWRLVTVGRLTPNKNQRTIVAAMPAIVAGGVDATLDVYGDGPCRAELEALAATLGVADRITFHGSVDHGEVMAAFAEADLNLLSTRQEGYGKVLLESMVHGTVAIFGESPVAGEISGGGSRGLVFPPDDDARLAELVVGLVEDRARWAAMVDAAREYAATMSLEAFQDHLRDMLERQWHVSLPVPGRAEPGS
jgi:glycosyltransferase involved in cell wall biosynthesis